VDIGFQQMAAIGAARKALLFTEPRRRLEHIARVIFTLSSRTRYVRTLEKIRNNRNSTTSTTAPMA
jgi:hypothetical protein